MNTFKNYAAIFGCVIASISISPAQAQLGGLLDDVVGTVEDTVDEVLGGGSGGVVDNSGSGVVNVGVGGDTVSVLPGNGGALDSVGLSGAGAAIGNTAGVTLGSGPANEALGVGSGNSRTSVLLPNNGGGLLPPGGGTTNNITNNYNTATTRNAVNNVTNNAGDIFNNNSRLSQLNMLLQAALWQRLNSCNVRVKVVDVQRWLPRNEQRGLYQVLGNNAQSISMMQSQMASKSGCILAQAGLLPSDVVAVDYRGGNEVTLLTL